VKIWDPKLANTQQRQGASLAPSLKRIAIFVRQLQRNLMTLRIFNKFDTGMTN